MNKHEKPTLREGSVALCTSDGIYIEVHGSAPVFDDMLPDMFRRAMEKLDEHREQAEDSV